MATSFSFKKENMYAIAMSNVSSIAKCMVNSKIIAGNADHFNISANGIGYSVVSRNGYYSDNFCAAERAILSPRVDAFVFADHKTHTASYVSKLKIAMLISDKKFRRMVADNGDVYYLIPLKWIQSERYYKLKY